jgi:hypothetical protein
MSGEVEQEPFEMRICFRGEDVSMEEYFLCFPLVMDHFDMENLMASPQHMFSGKNDRGTRIMVVFETDEEFAPTIFDVDKMLEERKAFIRYDA